MEKSRTEIQSKKLKIEREENSLSNTKANKTRTVLLILMALILVIAVVYLGYKSGGITGNAVFDANSVKNVYDAMQMAEDGEYAFSFVMGDDTSDLTKRSKIALDIALAGELARKFTVDRAYTANEKTRIIDESDDKNKKQLIIMGSSDVNSFSKQFLGTRQVSTGQAVIALDKTDGLRLYVIANNADDMSMAVKVLLDYKTYAEPLKSESVKITKDAGNYKIEAWT